MSIFINAERSIEEFQRSLALRRLGTDSLRDWQIVTDRQALRALIETLEQCETSVEQRIDRQNTIAPPPKLPKRLLATMLPPTGHETVKVKHDGPMGYKWVNGCDFDPNSMELTK
jgi:hypothetical protein